MRATSVSNDYEVVDPERKAPRWDRKLRFAADDGFQAEVLDVSAVGMRVRVTGAKGVEVGAKLWAGMLSFEDGSNVRIKVRVARVTRDQEHTELGLEIAEADKAFYDALPKLRHDSGETPIVE